MIDDLMLGSLCTGYGGLDLAVDSVLGTRTAWVSDIDPGACRILAHRYPDVPNLGDLTAVDWTEVEPVDVLTAGYPCQPFSHAGQRKGTSDDRHIWPNIADAIGVLRPRLVVLENVAGHLSLGGPAVVGDLARLGYDARWLVVRAADVGACHRRARLFIVGTNAHIDRLPVVERQQRGVGPRSDVDGLRALLPTPVVNDMGDGKTIEWWDNWTREQQSQTGNGNGHGKSLAIEAALLPTPRASLNENRQTKRTPSQIAGTHGLSLGAEVVEAFGEYQEAIDRHEVAVGRPAPSPLDDGRLSPRFVEWMMMLPPGWVTDVPNLSRVMQLKALGNGVVPPQASRALELLGVA